MTKAVLDRESSGIAPSRYDNVDSMASSSNQSLSGAPRPSTPAADPKSAAAHPTVGLLLSTFVGFGEVVCLLLPIVVAVGLGVVGLPVLIAILFAIVALFFVSLLIVLRPRSRRLSQAIGNAVSSSLTRRKHWYRRLPLMMGIDVTTLKRIKDEKPAPVPTDISAPAQESLTPKLTRKERKALKQGQAGIKASVPTALLGVELLEIPHAKFRRGRLGGVGVLFHTTERTLTAVLPVALSLPDTLDPDYLQRVAAAWNQAATALLQSRTLVKRVGWMTRVVRPVASVELILTEQLLNEFPELGGIDSLLMPPESLDWPRQATNQTLVSITIDARRAPVTKGFGVDAVAGAIDALLEELDACARGLKHFKFTVGAPLSPGEIVQFVHVAADPSLDTAQNLEREQLLSEVAGVVPRLDTPPEIDTSDWNYVRFNQSYHRAYWVAEWSDSDRSIHPLSVMQPNVPGIQTVAAVFSRSGINDAPLAAMRPGFDESLKTAPVEQASLVVVAAPSADHLAIQCDALEEAALRAGFELRPLHGRHDRGLVAALPYGFPVK